MLCKKREDTASALSIQLLRCTAGTVSERMKAHFIFFIGFYNTYLARFTHVLANSFEPFYKICTTLN